MQILLTLCDWSFRLLMVAMVCRTVEHIAVINAGVRVVQVEEEENDDSNSD